MFTFWIAKYEHITSLYLNQIDVIIKACLCKLDSLEISPVDSQNLFIMLPDVMCSTKLLIVEVFSAAYTYCRILMVLSLHLRDCLNAIWSTVACWSPAGSTTDQESN